MQTKSNDHQTKPNKIKLKLNQNQYSRNANQIITKPSSCEGWVVEMIKCCEIDKILDKTIWR